MAGYVDLCRFNPTAGGTGSWVYSSAVGGCQGPAAAGAQNGRLYKVYAVSADLTQWEIAEGAYNSGTVTFARTTVLFNSLGNTSNVNFTLAPQVSVVAIKEDLLSTDESCLAMGMTNGQLSASASLGALTVSVLTTAGNNPSALDPVFFYFRDNTLATGDVVRIAVTAALSVVLGSGATLGATSGNGLRVWIAAFNNAGTVQLGAINCSDTNGYYCPLEFVKFTTATPGNASKTWYSTSAIVTAAPWRFIGFCEWSSLTTAGTWTAPTTLQLFGPGIKRPGDIVQKMQVLTTTNDAVGTTSTSYVASSFTASITPQSAANLVEAQFLGGLNGTGGTNSVNCRIQRGTSWTGASGTSIASVTTGAPQAASSYGIDLPSSTASTTYTVYRRTNNAATTAFCPYVNTSTEPSIIVLAEIMG